MGIVRGSPEMAKPLVVGTDTVFVHTDIQPVTEDQAGNPVENEFQYHEIQYGKDEFIQLMAEQTAQNNDLMNTILGVKE